MRNILIKALGGFTRREYEGEVSFMQQCRERSIDRHYKWIESQAELNALKAKISKGWINTNTEKYGWSLVPPSE